MIHITGGDSSAEMLRKSGLDGDILVWRDLLYDGPRTPGWPSPSALKKRATFLTDSSEGAPTEEQVLKMLQKQYSELESSAKIPEAPLLWFDACLFDMAMLAHILTCWRCLGRSDIELIVVDEFEGIERYHGLGQLTPEQLASFFPTKQRVTDAQFALAEEADMAFAFQDERRLEALADRSDAAIRWLPAAAQRWIREGGSFKVLEHLILEALDRGAQNPVEVFKMASASDTPPQYWGDTTLWAKINAMASQPSPQITLSGPQPRLPVWPSGIDLKAFKIERTPPPS
jgi:hypothetical protein